jgi:hypothetical protein
MDYALKSIKAKWEKEIDYYLIIAVTVDLKCYPPEVQEIIKAEYQNRGLKQVA